MDFPELEYEPPPPAYTHTPTLTHLLTRAGTLPNNLFFWTHKKKIGLFWHCNRSLLPQTKLWTHTHTHTHTKSLTILGMTKKTDLYTNTHVQCHTLIQNMNDKKGVKKEKNICTHTRAVSYSHSRTHAITQPFTERPERKKERKKERHMFSHAACHGNPQRLLKQKLTEAKCASMLRGSLYSSTFK